MPRFATSPTGADREIDLNCHEGNVRSPRCAPAEAVMPGAGRAMRGITKRVATRHLQTNTRVQPGRGGGRGMHHLVMPPSYVHCQARHLGEHRRTSAEPAGGSALVRRRPSDGRVRCPLCPMYARSAERPIEWST